ncbi:MAG: Aminodeoxychorismate lyase [Parcubacteria group bacterium GW2011_GWF1_40_6]|nr:MAG: Aminodeoxychorismate lyase [Candidatus Nomurabacteria bacterium GW2011_GWF2_40_12]KKR68825.1 MAG: Aminodeoxychorismate lyase [Parcubacteria group bacterium GW2011_GWF1_40_6]
MDNPPENNELGYRVSKLNKKSVVYTLGFVLFVIIFYSFFLSAPKDFPVGAVVRIEPGMGLRSVSSLLKKQHVIRSRVIFESFMIIFGAELHIISTDYFFENKLSAWSVARRIGRGEHNMAPISVTIPEGFDRKQIGDTFSLKLTYFDKVKFLSKTEGMEGYLFPDTYFFLTDSNETDVINSMNGNFKKKIMPLLPDITAFGKTEKEIITMASIIEREAKGDTDREIISGILWKRIKIGMPLQVDAAPETYKIKELPKNPISNPGLLSIKAAIHPVSSSYLYYLHDKNGYIHYAKSFTEHQANIRKYLTR